MKTDPAAEIDSQGAKFNGLEMSPQIVESSKFFSFFRQLFSVHEQTNGLKQRTNLGWIFWGEFGQESSSPFSQPTQVANGFPLLRFCWEESQHCSLRGEKTCFECEQRFRGKMSFVGNCKKRWDCNIIWYWHMFDLQGLGCWDSTLKLLYVSDCFGACSRSSYLSLLQIGHNLPLDMDHVKDSSGSCVSQLVQDCILSP